MLIHLCNTPDERNIINKDIRQVGDVNAVIKGELSIEKPIFIFDFSGNADSINYMIVSELGRNYFIDEIIHLTGHRYEIHASCDVLESFKSSILSLSCVIEKQENNLLANKYYNDGSFISQEKEFIYTKEFPDGFLDDGEYILITAGGIAT
jgi:hypothetical protein